MTSFEIKGSPLENLNYSEILNQNGITEKISQVIVTDPEARGNGFATQALYIQVKFENPEIAPLNLFGKTYTNNALHRKLVSELKAFEKEAKFYNEYVPKAKTFCENIGQGDLMDIYAKCYYANKELILLENLVLDKNYRMKSNEKLLDLEEAKAALVTLAKHHAISYAMIEEHGGREMFLKEFEDFDFNTISQPQFRMIIEPMVVIGTQNFIKMIEKYPVEDGDLALEILKSNAQSVFENILEPLAYNPNEDTLFVLNHGDYWKNNMMFLKDQNGKILHHKTVDMQILEYNSPGIDLTYFMYTSVKPEVILHHLNPLLEHYFSNLKKVSNDLRHPIKVTFEQIFFQFRKKIKYGFWFGFPLSSGPGNAAFKDFNINEITDMKELGDYYDKGIQKWMHNNPHKVEQVVEDIIGLVEQYNQLKL